MKGGGRLLWALVLAGAGLADIAATLVIRAGGGGELNPVMAGLLRMGTPAFALVKAGVDVGGASVLYALWPHSRLARVALPILAALQAAAVVYGLGAVVWAKLFL